MGGGPLPGLSCVINTVTYPVREWRTTPGERLTEVWQNGFRGGFGEFKRRTADGIFASSNMDLSGAPYARLRIAPTNITASGQAENVLHVFSEMGGATAYIYVLLGRYGLKLSADGATLHSTKDFGANAVAGKPAKFNGNWFVPLGASVNAVRLTAVGAGAAADTWTSVGVKALGFASIMKDGIAQLARGHTVNLVDLTADETDTLWTGDDFEVGEATFSITCMMSWNGQVAVIKEDNVFAFDAQGTALPVQDFLAKPASFATAGIQGAMSDVHGPYLYWATGSAIWRIVGQRAKPIGPAEQNPGLQSIANHPSANFFGTQVGQRSVAAFGEYIYCASNRHIWQGRLREDGSAIWSEMQPTTAASAQVAIVQVADGAVFLVTLDAESTEALNFIQLAVDGGTTLTGAADYGKASESSFLILPNVDFGIGDRQKQLRRMWVKAENPGSTSPIQLAVHRDRANSEENVGATITAAGYAERLWTPGTNDLCYEVMPRVEIDTTAGYSAAEGPRIYEIGIECATPSIIQVEIPVTVKGLKPLSLSRTTVMQALRNLLNGATVNVTEPVQGAMGDTFPARVVGLAEGASRGGGNQEGAGYSIFVTMERYEWGS